MSRIWMWAEPRCVVLWGDVVWCEVLTSMVSVVKEATRASLSGVMCWQAASELWVDQPAVRHSCWECVYL